MSPMLPVALVDVGGTLWPNSWPSQPTDHEQRVTRLLEAAPSLSQRQAAELVSTLSRLDQSQGERQETKTLVEAVAAQVGSPPISVTAVVRAICLPMRGRLQPFPGASELLAGLAQRGVRVVVVSNVTWRDGEAYRRDFADAGLADYVAEYVTSFDVGWRKPHPAFFEVAGIAARHPWSQCLMVGDSEPNDIAPAKQRGMHTIRVAIEEPIPSATVADHVCSSLYEVMRLLFEG